MKNLLILLSLLPSVLFGSAAFDLPMTQRNSANTGNVLVTVSPAANSLLGFDNGKLVSNVTAGSGITIAGGTISATGGGTGTVTSVAETFTGGIVSVAGSPITTSGTLALTIAGTSGGVPYFSDGTHWASSGALAANAIVIGGGAGSAPSTTTTGTNVLTALGVNVGSAGAFVVNGGALGTPSSGNASNLTNFPTLNQNTTGSAASLSISGQTGLLTFTGLASTNRAKTVRDAADTILELGGSYTPTGTWTNLTLVTPTLGTPASGTVTNLTGTASININGTVGATTPTTGAFTTASATTFTGALSGNATTATTLATARAIYGNNFDGSAALTQIIASTYGGTGNGFTKFSGPATSEKTFTLPNASATILTDNAAVTVAQGGTGIASGTSGGVPYFSGSTTIASSAALAANAIVIGGGAGAAPATTTTGTGILTFLGTPSSANLASAVTDETGSGALVFGTAPQISTIELGAASDTTIARVSAGVISVEGVTVDTISATNTLTNKRITKRTGTTTSSATPTINTDNVDFYSLTAQAADITSMTTNLSGTPTEAQMLWIAITGTAARAITWGTSFEAGAVSLPTTTVTTTRLDVLFIWNTVTSKWRCMASGSG